MHGGVATTTGAINNLIDAVANSEFVGFDTETTGLDFDRRIVGFSVCVADGTSWYVPMRHDGAGNANHSDAIRALQAIFLDKGTFPQRREVWIHNKTFDLHCLRNEGIDPAKAVVNFYDSMVLAWMLNPDAEKGLKALIFKHFGYKMVEYDELLKKYGSNTAIPVSAMAPYAIDDVRFLPALVRLLKAKLADTGPAMTKAFYELETPIGDLIDRMQATGINLDVPYLNKLDQEFAQKEAELTEKAHDILGLPVGMAKLGSTQWLSKTLIKGVRWWRPAPGAEVGANGHYSTDRASLEAWSVGVGSTKSGQELAEVLLEIRKLSKLRSTYTSSLPGKVQRDGRIHTSFSQSIARTGRFTSSDPNLQNIPIRTYEGAQIRAAFIPNDGYLLLDADYSQVELRLLAHFSQDPVLLEIYRNNGDIHENTSKSLGCSRSAAKGINFGLNYGMGVVKLAYTIKSSVEDATRWMAGYFREYAGIKMFRASIANRVRQDGYVTTLVGRRRYLPNITSKDGYLRSQAERQAANTRIQGSAADLIMLAMRNIQTRFSRERITWDMARPVSQVHDELIYEVRKDIADDAREIVKFEMENAVKLTVPLIAEPALGVNWKEAH